MSTREEAIQELRTRALRSERLARASRAVAREFRSEYAACFPQGQPAHMEALALRPFVIVEEQEAKVHDQDAAFFRGLIDLIGNQE